MRYVVTLVAGLSMLAAHCAAQSQTSYHMQSMWAIRGKVLPWMFISASGINYSLGVEYGFKKANAVGLDFVYNDQSSAHEIFNAQTNKYVSGPRMYYVHRGIFLSYRRYLVPDDSRVYEGLERLVGVAYLPYVGIFTRYGKTDHHPEAGYETPILSHDEWQYSVGPLAGVVVGVVDINIAPFYKQKYTSETLVENTQHVLQSKAKGNFGFRVGVNLIGVFKNKKDHRLAQYLREE